MFFRASSTPTKSKDVRPVETWCLFDYEYPKREIESALYYHFHAVAQMYKVQQFQIVSIIL